MRCKQDFLVSILLIATIISARKTTTTRHLTEEEEKKLKNADNRKTHPKVKAFNLNSNNRPTTCQGNINQNAKSDVLLARSHFNVLFVENVIQASCSWWENLKCDERNAQLRLRLPFDKLVNVNKYFYSRTYFKLLEIGMLLIIYFWNLGGFGKGLKRVKEILDILKRLWTLSFK